MSLGADVGHQAANEVGLFTRLWRHWEQRSLLARLNEFERNEVKRFVVQKLLKVEGILGDEQTKLSLANQLVCANGKTLFQNADDVLRKKYGSSLLLWLRLTEQERHLNGNDVSARAKALKKGISSAAQHADAEGVGSVVNIALSHVDDFKEHDPLSNWFRLNSDTSSRMITRIRNFATRVCATVQWSFLIEPGRPRIDLSNFVGEFEVLERFLESVELSEDERVQKAFDSNYLSKARNKSLECVDFSRVVLKVPEELTEDSKAGGEAAAKRRPQPSDIFGDLDCPLIPVRSDYGTGDFIHANYVLGGPLLNTFVLTQAPMPDTVGDFWRMVWQEKSEFIFMLCGAVEPDGLGLLGAAVPEHCPYYWPRFQGETRRFGKLMVRNEKLDGLVDPLFNVTKLAVWVESDPADVLRVEHWQYDWRDYTDYHWPLRLLRRSRQSKRPTIVHCMDGCGRSGVLVLIEVMLMQLLRGTTANENPMLTAAIFLRLQRRHAVANQIQYLYAYRTLLHWCEPYISSTFQRFVIGYLFAQSGFLGKYEQLAVAYARRNNITLPATANTSN